uniref:Putative secreted protein n=1 Tax=Anopheles triannulatus TaxID=58253 RepID=A0A2M4B1L5_9DIPT
MPPTVCVCVCVCVWSVIMACTRVPPPTAGRWWVGDEGTNRYMKKVRVRANEFDKHTGTTVGRRCSPACVTDTRHPPPGSPRQ